MQNLDPIQPLPPPVPQSAGYEFTGEQNAIVGKLASRMRLAGIAQIVFGALQLLGNCGIAAGGGSFKLNTTSSPVYLALIVSGAFLIASASAFQKIVTTEGSDIGHLMNAIRHFSRSLMVQLVTYAVLAVLILLMVVLMALVLALFAAALTSLLK